MSAIVAVSFRSTAAWYWTSRAATAFLSSSIIFSLAMQTPAATLTATPQASALQPGLPDMALLLKMKPTLGRCGAMRFHDLAQLGSLAGASRSAECVRRQPEERAESGGEMTVARESGVEGD